MKKSKNQSYAVLDLLCSIKEFINNNSQINLENLKTNYILYNERFVKVKSNLTKEEQKSIIDFITRKYDENIYILKNGEIENYLGTGTTNKTIGFKKVISFLNDIDMYNEFKNSEDFKELKFIIHNINSKIKKL